MNPLRTGLLLASFAVLRVVAEEPVPAPVAPATNSPLPRYDSSSLLPPPMAPITVRQEFSVPNKSEARARGFLARPLAKLKQSKILNFPRKLLKSMNPFAPLEPTQPTALSGDLNPCAWTTMVGWRPGASAFYDPITFEW